MILNNAPQNEAVLSNVGEIGEFRIRNSAKAFSILSSGLYANKIRAIVRELSCNAVDSHAAAGKKDVPFDVHLPNSLEPHFSIRDYGTGLSHEQVTQIYTTYFESTKTASNEFIGALGLGSKSPFSYTDNFTVTAIQNGKKGIYSAFINGEGVPSIALMMTEDTEEPNGVEVKFSVNERYDFDKFRQEARTVYTHFKLRPVIHGNADFKFIDIEYESKDIIPGVHSITGGHRRSVAVMGNIAYPIELPQTERSSGAGESSIYSLLSCGLEMHFNIGELDFQASREGLSYIPETIAAIKAKLEAVNSALTTVLATEANAITNLWDRTSFLTKKKESVLWSNAVTKYVTDTNFELLVNQSTMNAYYRPKTFEFEPVELTKKYNIQIRGFSKSRGMQACANSKVQSHHNKRKDGSGYDIVNYWPVTVSDNMYFVINDLKIGATERAKNHWRKTQWDPSTGYSHQVYVLEPVDRNKPMNTKQFFLDLSSPPESRIMVASSLMEKERAAGVGQNVTIMKLTARGYGGYYREREMVWKDGGKINEFDDKKTYYYIPLSGFTPISAYETYGFSAHDLMKNIQESGVDFGVETLYGVRKGDIEDIKGRKNWVNIEAHIAKVLPAVNNKLMMRMVVTSLDAHTHIKYNSDLVEKIEQDSPFRKLVEQFQGVNTIKFNQHSLTALCKVYAKTVTLDPSKLIAQYASEVEATYVRYPLLKCLTYSVDNHLLADYINMIDKVKKAGI